MGGVMGVSTGVSTASSIAPKNLPKLRVSMHSLLLRLLSACSLRVSRTYLGIMVLYTPEYIFFIKQGVAP